MRTMSALLGLGLLLALLAIATHPEPVLAQAPDSPSLPTPHSVCRLDDGPKPGWVAFRNSALGVALQYPRGWSVHEAERGRRVVFVDRNRTVLQALSMDTQGLSPGEWLRIRIQAEKKRQCRTIIMGALVGQQCLNPGTRTLSTFLALSNRVLALEASSTLSRETLCGVLMGIEDLARRVKLTASKGRPMPPNS